MEFQGIKTAKVSNKYLNKTSWYRAPPLVIFTNIQDMVSRMQEYSMHAHLLPYLIFVSYFDPSSRYGVQMFHTTYQILNMDTARNMAVSMQEKCVQCMHTSLCA